MITTFTCGPENRRTSFEYELLTTPTVRWVNQGGSVVVVNGHFIDCIRNQFRGQTIDGGFSATAPTPGGLGEWVGNNSRVLNGQALTPQHASRIAAIMRDLGWVESCVEGNAVRLRFLA